MSADSTKSPGGDYEQLRALGKYQIVKRLGAGGMGAVFLATDTELRRAVALKVLPKDRAENPTLLRRFKAEAQAVAQLRHDNIVAIYETGEIKGFPYLALEYVDGIDVMTLIAKRGVVPPKRSLKIIRQVAQALQHAFERNIVHRDIKPSNLLIQVDGTTKVTDFGLARSIDESLDTSITRAGTTVGTVDYISPEQACDSKAADIRSDIYSLGCTWYHMLTGEPPYPEGTLQNKLHGHINTPTPNPRELNPNIPEGYVAVIHRMMSKRPQDRYQTPAELVEDLDQVAGSVSQINAALFDSSVRIGERAASSAEIEVAPPPTRKAAPKEKSKPSKPIAYFEGERDDESVAAESAPSRIDPKLKGRGGPVRKPTATRGPHREDVDIEAGEEVEAEGGRSSKSRKLPPRHQKAPGGFAIDLDYARIGLIALVVLGAVGLFWWAFSRGSTWTTGGGAGVAKNNPDAAPAEQARPNQPVNPKAPQGPGPRAPQGPPAVAPRASVITTVPSSQAPDHAPLAAASSAADGREGPPFPGTEDLPGQDSKAAREWVPDWVYAVRSAAPAVQPVVVETRAQGASVGSIDAALARLSGRERIIELRGSGPFPLNPVVVRDCDLLILRAADGSEPVVVLQGVPDAERGHGHVQLTGGVLALVSLHIVDAATTSGGNSADGSRRSLFAVEGGTLSIRHCSVTIPDEAEPVVVGRVRGSDKYDYPSRLLLEGCLFRGKTLAAVDCSGPAADVVIGGSLLASGAGPLVMAEATQRPAVQAVEPANADPKPGADVANDAVEDSGAKAAPALVLRILGSTLWTAGAAIQLRETPGDEIQQAQVQLRRSLCLASDGGEAVLADLSEWPQRATSVSGQPKAAGLTWRQDRTWLSGWTSLVRLKESQVVTEEDWRSAIGAPLETGSLGAEPLPQPAEWSRVDGEMLAAAERAVPREFSQGAAIGIAEPLPAPPNALMDRHLMLAGRPRLPATFLDLPKPREVIEIDLKRPPRDWNALLNGPETPDGSWVRLKGIGLVNLPPLLLKGKSLTLEFVQSSEGAPLTIRPEYENGMPPDAWLIVEGGRLDLIGARIQESPSQSRKSAPRLLLVRDGSFSLRNCYVEGGPAEANGPGLIEWTQSKRSGPRQHGYVADSQFAGPQPLLAADVDNRLLVVRNCLLAGQGDGIALRTSAGAADIARSEEGWVVLEHNTLLFGGRGLTFSGLVAGRATPAVRILSTACVFAPAPGVDAAKIALLRQPDGMTARNLFDWWENRNGYAPALKVFRDSGMQAEPPAQQFESDWRTFWGGEHVQSPQTGVNGVLFATVLTSLGSLSPPGVALSRSCSGASAAVDGGAIGIRPERVGPLARGPASSPSAPQAGPSGVARPPNRPDF